MAWMETCTAEQNAAFQVDPGDLQDEETEQGGEDRRKKQRYLGRKSQPDVRARLQADVDHSEGDDKGADEQNGNSREKSRPTAQRRHPTFPPHQEIA